MNEKLHINLIETLKEKIPERGKLTGKLAEILFLEKETVYRRLRGEVPFSFHEVAVIAKQMNISLDSIIERDLSKSKPFEMKLIDYSDLTELDYYVFQKHIGTLKLAGDDAHSEYASATNIIPFHFIVRYEHLYRICLLKWMYQFGSPDSVKTYSEIKFTDKLKDVSRDFLTEIENINYTYFIWDKFTFLYFINDIKYFTDIHLIAKEELELIKEELFLMIDYLEKLATTGKFSSKKSIQFYLSRLNFDTTYTYMQFNAHHVTLIESYIATQTISSDEEVFRKIKTWIQSLKRTSTLISESGEIQRMEFFKKQREYINEL